MPTRARIKSIYVREDKNYAVNVEVSTDLVEALELRLIVQADGLRNVPDEVHKKLFEFASQLAYATDSIQKME